MKNVFGSAILLLFFTLSYGQKADYNTSAIADSLKENANAVIRLNQVDIDISSQRNMKIKTKRVITILNEKGLGVIDAFENYNKSTSVKSIDAVVYNSFGKEIKKISRKDFKDQTAIAGGTLFSDNRLIYLEYIPTEYPFTIVFESEITTSNTAFIPQWRPLSDYYVSVEKSVLNVNYPPALGFKKKELNFANYRINKTTDTETQLSYTVSNLLPLKYEDNSPSTVFPKLMLGLEQFNLEGVDGTVKTWKEYGQWFSENILTGTTDLSDETKMKIKELVGNETDPINKAEIVYKYMQGRTRYVSVQVGIGGFKPMLAKDVDRLGYGDCKALSNYTRALLDVVGVQSYYTELYGSSYKMDIMSDFFSIQGNHVVLAIPNGDNYIWLECTSQEDPFGYQGTFTDDRYALIVKPEGGEIVRTKVYPDDGNSQISKGNYSLLEDGTFLGSVTIVSQGSQYSRKFSIEKMSPVDKDAHYKEYWDNISNLKIKKATFSNDKEKVTFTENVEVSAANYGVITGNKMMFVVNGFNKFSSNVKKIRNRKSAFEIQRGYFDNDEIEINLPSGFNIEAIPNNFEFKTKFGEYKAEFIKKEKNTILYKRSIFVKKGLYRNTEYDEYRLFMEQVSKNDNAKIILIKN